MLTSTVTPAPSAKGRQPRKKAVIAVTAPSAADSLLHVLSAAAAQQEGTTMIDNDEAGASPPAQELEPPDDATGEGVSRKRKHNITERRRVERNNQAFDDLHAALNARPDIYIPSTTTTGRTKLALLQESVVALNALYAQIDALKALRPPCVAAVAAAPPSASSSSSASTHEEQPPAEETVQQDPLEAISAAATRIADMESRSMSRSTTTSNLDSPNDSTEEVDGERAAADGQS